jgi:hypothetical protein
MMCPSIWLLVLAAHRPSLNFSPPTICSSPSPSICTLWIYLPSQQAANLYATSYCHLTLPHDYNTPRTFRATLATLLQSQIAGSVPSRSAKNVAMGGSSTRQTYASILKNVDLIALAVTSETCNTITASRLARRQNVLARLHQLGLPPGKDIIEARRTLREIHRSRLVGKYVGIATSWVMRIYWKRGSRGQRRS